MPRFSPEQGIGRKPGQYRERRRALKMLADAPRGVSKEMLVVVHGFSAEMLAGLVLVGLATVVTETRVRPAARRSRLSVFASRTRAAGRSTVDRTQPGTRRRGRRWIPARGFRVCPRGPSPSPL
jgi:hypothetical protein